MFKRILIANRGEIALRIIRACRELGVETVCVYSTADSDAPYLRLADHTVCIGKAPASESYINMSRIISAAEVTDSDAIHPGYGFLAENSEFAAMCRDCQIAFVGPSPEAMYKLGDKISCKKLARAAKMPTFPGSEDAIEEEEEAVSVAQKIGFPVIVKAAAGGGGRGMRIAHNIATLRTGLKSAKQEAESAFGNGAVYIEKFLESARHIEVQVLADSHGNSVHLYERDCSTQRRHQKLIEEAPAPHVDPKKRDEVCKAAARLVRNAEYVGAATVEMLLDDKSNFYLLEVNTRVQVEHPVTEMITGIDIVKTQIMVAAGEPLPFKQRQISVNGHAIECRINAEDPANDFVPSAGKLALWNPPGGMGVRVDSHVYSGMTVPPFYDSMLAKLIVYRENRREAIACMRRALEEFTVEGVKTTIPLLLELLAHSRFANGEYDTNFVENYLRGT